MMQRFGFAAAMLSAGIILAAGEAVGDEEASLALRYCGEMTDSINTLVDYTHTDCFPGRGKKGMDFIFLSSRPVFSVEASKKAWLLVVVASFGKVFNNNAMKTELLIVSDASLMKQRQSYRIPAPVARELQRLVYNGDIELDAMYSRILEAMEPLSVPE